MRARWEVGRRYICGGAVSNGEWSFTHHWESVGWIWEEGGDLRRRRHESRSHSSHIVASGKVNHACWSSIVTELELKIWS